MTSNDEDYIKLLIADNILQAPILELGTGYGGSTSRDLIRTANLKYYGTDFIKTDSVDYTANFENRQEVLQVFGKVGPFGSVLALNVLEHTYNPICVLDNCLGILKPNGVLVVITPTFWALHNFPTDTWRINPNFYEQYAKKNNLKILEKYFRYIGFGAVINFKDSEGNYRYPKPTDKRFYWVYSRIIHKIFNTCGRGMSCPSQFATGVVFVR